MNTVENSLNDIVNILSAPWTMKDWLIAITPLVISLLSIPFAVYVPYRIMNKQNQIALFDKRFTIYQQVKQIIDFCSFIEKIKGLPIKQNPSSLDFAQSLLSLWCSKNEKVNAAFKMLQKEPNNSDNIFYFLEIATEALQEQVAVLKTSEYLLNDDASKQVLVLSEKYNEFITLLIGSIVNEDMKEYENKKNALCSFIENNKNIENNFKFFLKL